MSEESVNIAEEQAYQLAQAAIMLDNARNDRSDLGKLAAALERNLETWVALKTLILHPDCRLGDAVKGNLLRLSAFVAERTMQGVDAITDTTIDSLINVNLQISEGLLEGASK